MIAPMISAARKEAKNSITSKMPKAFPQLEQQPMLLGLALEYMNSLCEVKEAVRIGKLFMYVVATATVNEV